MKKTPPTHDQILEALKARVNEQPVKRCQTCQREMRAIQTDDDPWSWEMSYDHGDRCSGCVAVEKEEAVYAHCAFHDRDCVVWKHYEGSTHLCDAAYCIEEQDITTLMINASYARWEDGEENAFFDHLIGLAEGVENGTVETVDYSAMTTEEYKASLMERFGRKDGGDHAE